MRPLWPKQLAVYSIGYYYYDYYYLKSRRGESNFIRAIRSIIDADMAKQQRVHGIFKDF